MSEDIEDLLKVEEQFDSNSWKKKVIITKNEYLTSSLELCNNYFIELKPKNTLLQKYENHEGFEKYLMRYTKQLDKLLKTYEDSDLEDYLIGIDARIGILKDKEDVFQSVFFKTFDEEGNEILNTLPKFMYDKYDLRFKKEEETMKQNEGMYI